jgi:SAM-dependent methyltransferase
VKSDLTDLPFEDGEFDAVFCISVIEHLPWESIPLALLQLRRVLRPGGRLLLTTDYCRGATEEMWYEGPGERFRVDWSVFDEPRLRRFILEAEGFRVEGEVDLRVDWDTVAPAMIAFHGYPYTAVGVGLVKTGYQ